MPRVMARRKTRGNRELANVWIGTVLNPILRGLLQEKYLPGRSLTWRHFDKRFEDLFSVEELVGGYYWPNCQQLLDFSAEFKENTERYDKSLEEFRKSCSSAFEVLTRDQQFQEWVKEVVAGNPQADASTSCYFADYTINMVQELPASYTYHTAWNNNRLRFEMMRKRPDRVGEVLKSVEKQGTMFNEALEKFLACCNRLRDDLADKFGLPRVPVINGALV